MGSPHQGGGAGFVGGVHIGAAVNQQAHTVVIAVNRRKHQRCVARGVTSVHGSASVQRFSKLSGTSAAQDIEVMLIDGGQVRGCSRSRTYAADAGAEEDSIYELCR